MMVNEETVIDEKNRNTYWQDAISKEMENDKVVFQIIPVRKHLIAINMSIAKWCLMLK